MARAVGFGLALAPAALAVLIWKAKGSAPSRYMPLPARRCRRSPRCSIGSTRSTGTPGGQHVGPPRILLERSGLQWAPLAGAVAVARRSLPACGLLAGWLFAFVLVKGSSPVATVDSGSFFRLLMPAFPAFIVLVAAVPLLVPGLFRRLGEDIAPVATAPLGRRALVALAVVLAALPVGAVAVAQPVDGPEHAIIVDEILVPVDSEAMGLRVEVTNAGNRLTWDEPARASRGSSIACIGPQAAADDVRCEERGATKCDLEMDVLGGTGEELPRPRRPGMGLVPNQCRCQLGGRSGPGRRLPPQRARPGAVRARLAERWPEAAAGGLALAGGLLYMRRSTRARTTTRASISAASTR